MFGGDVWLTAIPARSSALPGRVDSADYALAAGVITRRLGESQPARGLRHVRPGNQTSPRVVSFAKSLRILEVSATRVPGRLEAREAGDNLEARVSVASSPE